MSTSHDIQRTAFKYLPCSLHVVEFVNETLTEQRDDRLRKARVISELHWQKSSLISQKVSCYMSALLIASCTKCLGHGMPKDLPMSCFGQGVSKVMRVDEQPASGPKYYSVKGTFLHTYAKLLQVFTL